MATLPKRAKRHLGLLAAMAVSAACQDQLPFDTGWERFAPDRRERLTLSQPFDRVSTRLQDRLHMAGMDRLKAAARKEPSLFTVDSRHVLITHFWLAGSENVAPFSPFFACANGRQVSVAAGTLFVMERRQGTEIEFHLGFAATEAPGAVDDCTLRPGLLASLVALAGLT
jgi:hypothetical protein